VKNVFPVFLFCLLWSSGISGQRIFEKVKGVSLESPPFELAIDDYETLASTNANWVAVIPYGFSGADNPSVHFDSERQWWGERVEGAYKMVSLAKETGYKVMMKPQVWVFREWVGNHGFDTEEEWQQWENSYENFIITFAHLADSLGVEIFCLGTEYKRSTSERVEFWLNLIESVRSIYSGKLTYAANWDEYELIPFWAKLDYIGVDAYFPLSEEQAPEISELLLKWLPVKEKMKATSDSLNKSILLTEFGYRSVDGAAGAQWKLDSSPLNLEAQRIAYLALFEMFWIEDWIAGGFFWKWRFHPNAGGEKDKSYTPQGKPAMKIIQSVYE